VRGAERGVIRVDTEEEARMVAQMEEEKDPSIRWRRPEGFLRSSRARCTPMMEILGAPQC